MKRMIVWMALFLGGIIFMMTGCSREIHPPVAERIVHRDTLFGDIRTDFYYWLRERENPKVLDYLKAENRYTENTMADTRELQESLFKELKSHIKETDISVPVRFGDYFYYIREEAGKQYPIYCRKKGSLEADEEIYLDVNQLARGKKYFRIGSMALSPDHQKLAYIADTTGREKFILFIKDLKSGKTYPEAIPNVSYGIAWANDNQTIFYATLDTTLRPYRVYRHTVNTAPEKDALVYQENDGKYYVSIRKSRSGKYIFLELNSQITSERWFLNADQPTGAIQVIKKREYGVEYSIAHQGNYFYIVTNKNAVNFKIMRTRTSHPGERYWKEFIPHDPKRMIISVDAFKDFLVISQRENGLRQLRIKEIRSGKEYTIPTAEEVYTMSLGNNPEYNTRVIRYNYTSLVTPYSVFDFDIRTGKSELKKRKEVPGYNPDLYEARRVWATAKDGTKIPLSIVYRKGFKQDGTHPCYLYGYGAYGATIEPRFSSNRLVLLDRGFVFAIAHIRGGGAMGRQWYLDGKLLKKKNTFTDFIAAAEYLIREKYTERDRLVISGGSAGGLLMGAVTNMRPDLFKAVIAKVPFVDVLNTMLDPSIPLTVIEYDEWGNPHKKEYYFYIKSYSPYDNVKTGEYPNMLVTAGLYDPRVQYWEPAKWVAKLRHLKKDHHLLLLKTNMSAGHFSYSGRYDYLKDVAFEYAFIFKVFQMNQEK
jgi:oligopeptidase B